MGGWRETGFLRQTWRQFSDLGKNPVSVVLREYRRVRRYQISSSTIELLTATHDTKYSLTTETCVHKKNTIYGKIRITHLINRHYPHDYHYPSTN